MIDSMLPFGARAGNLYVGRTPYGSRPVINITPGTFQGSARAPKGSRPAPLDTVRCPLYLLTRIGEKESRDAQPFAGRSPGGLLVQPAWFFTGCLRDTGLNKTQRRVSCIRQGMLTLSGAPSTTSQIGY